MSDAPAKRAPTSLLVAVTLYVRRGRELEFHDFEARALGVAARHGGALLRAARLAERAKDEEAPYEFHLLAFPSEEAFAAFRADPERAAMREEAERVLVRTDVVAGVECTSAYVPS